MPVNRANFAQVVGVCHPAKRAHRCNVGLHVSIQAPIPAIVEVVETSANWTSCVLKADVAVLKDNCVVLENAQIC